MNQHALNIEEEQNKPTLTELYSEVNLLVLPFFALHNQDIRARQEANFETTVNRNGETYKVGWHVSANTKYGYPGPLAKKVHRALEDKLYHLPFPLENPIQFSIYELCQKLGEAPGGRQYKRIKKALKSIKTTSIESEGSFYHKKNKEFIEKVFSLYDELVFKGEKFEDGTIAETNYVYLNRFYLESINERYVRPLNFTYYQKLKNNLTQRLYEILGVKFYNIIQNNIPFIRYKYSTIVQLLPLKRRRYFSEAKRTLEKAHRELINTGFLSKCEWEETDNQYENDWLIHYYPGHRAREEVNRYASPDESLPDPKSNKEEGPPENEDEYLVRELVDELDDPTSERFYRKAVKSCPHRLIHEVLSEVKYRAKRGKIKKSKGACFTYILKEDCRELGIELDIDES